MPSIVDDVKGLIKPSEEESDWGLEGCSLSWTQRLWGFGICFTVGCVLSVISTLLVTTIVTNPAKFAVPYALGAMCSLCSTLFLMGPLKQCKSMFAKTRIIATIVYLLAIVGTLVAAFSEVSGLVVLLCIIVQSAALFWYGLSYIPYGRKMCMGCCQTATGISV